MDGERLPQRHVVLAGSPDRRVVREWQNRADLVPFQVWPELPGRVVGVLWAAGPQPWGATVSHAGGFERHPSRTEYKFAADGSSPYALYFPSDGQGSNVLDHWSVPLPDGSHAVMAPRSAMFLPSTPNPWGLHRAAHLVEVEVNHGRGGHGHYIHFVATDVRVLDGTDAFAPHVDDVFVALRSRFDATLEEHQAEIVEHLSSVQRELGDDVVRAPSEDVIAILPTWLTRENALEVLFYREVQFASEGAPREEWSECPPCPPGAPCMACDPQMIRRTPYTTYGYRFAIRYRVDPRGVLVTETIYAPVTFRQGGVRGDGDRPRPRP